MSGPVIRLSGRFHLPEFYDDDAGEFDVLTDADIFDEEPLVDHNEDEDVFYVSDSGNSFLAMFSGYFNLTSLEDLS